jgi:hypothetical protein
MINRLGLALGLATVLFAVFPFGDLPLAARTVAMKAGRLEDRLEAQSLAVCTTAFDRTPPAPVTGLQATQVPDGKKQLKWQPNREGHLCNLPLPAAC